MTIYLLVHVAIHYLQLLHQLLSSLKRREGGRGIRGGGGGGRRSQSCQLGPAANDSIQVETRKSSRNTPTFSCLEDIYFLFSNRSNGFSATHLICH